MYILLLVLIEIFLFVTNYTPGTYLMGWDNLMPEFDLWLNLKRAVFGVWQEYRGLGLPDGLSHTATLMHTVYISILRLILPQSIVRYIFIFGTHLAGGIGFFFLLKNLTKNSKASFLGAIFYMLNVAVVQMYFAPLEAFAVHFAALPLITLFAIKALQKLSLKNSLLFFLASFLVTPQSFVPTLFIVFCIFFFFLLFFHKKYVRSWREVIVVFIIFISANLFWLLPYSYSAFYNSKVIPHTKINQFSSEEIFYRNKTFGDLLSVFRFNGFMIETVEYNHLERKNDYFMKSWRDYQNNIFYNLAFIGLMVTALVGLVSIIKQRKKEFYPFVATSIASLIFLGNNTPLLSQLNEFLRWLFPVFAEAVRFPFTKFATLFAFCISVFLTCGIVYILEKFSRWRKQIVIVLVVFLLGISLNAFRGNFVSPLLRVKLPQEYLALMSYLNKQDENERIALLPAHTFWNWQYRQWGQRGSGFLWYGIKQPILERPFDPWSLYNEQFYNELAYAINSQQISVLENVLQKYDISYVLVDHNIVNNLSSKPINYGQINRFLSKVDFLQKRVEFGTLTLYKNTIETPRIYSLPKNTPAFSNSFFLSNIDQIYDQFGNYLFSSSASMQYPLVSLYSGKLQSDLEVKIENKSDKIVISPKNKDFPDTASTILIPDIFATEPLIPVQANIADGSIILSPAYPSIYINGQKIVPEGQTIILPINYVFSPSKITLVDTNQEFKSGESIYIRNNYPNIFKLTGNGKEEFIKFDTRIYKSSSQTLKFDVGVIKDVKIEIAKIKSPYTFEHLIKPDAYKIYVPTKQEVLFKRADSFVKVSEDKKNKKVSFEVKGNSADLSIWVDKLPHEASYIAFANNKYESGLPLTFSIDNTFEKRSEIETRLSKNIDANSVILPPTQQYFQGYGFHFTSKSVGTEISKNTVGDLSIYPFPYETLTNIRIESQDEKSYIKVNKSLLSFNKSNYSSYNAIKPGEVGDYIVLSQSFHPGWKAYQDGKELKEHVLINNWANGWKLERNGEVKIVFWPQYLEFAGFGLLIISLLVVILSRRKLL